MPTQSSWPPAILVRAVRKSATFGAGPRLRIGVPVALVVAMLLISDLLRAVFPGGGVFLLMLLPVLVCSIALGARSGLIAQLLGAAGALLMVVLRGHPWLTEPTDVLRLVPYFFIGAFVVLLASVLRTAVGRPAAGLGTLGRHPAARPEEPPTPLIEPLTSREAEVLGLAASGLSTNEIGGRLYLSRNTVKSHLAHAYAKLGARNRAEAVAAGLHSGSIQADLVMARAAEITTPVTASPVRSRRGQVASLAAK